MLAGVQERKMRIVRGALSVAWLVLIASLFWDPISPTLTRPDNLASPFHLPGKAVLVQGQALPEVPYQMSNRIFWTMIVPILPLFFLVAGHEAWRRICPLSFISQIPRYLGLNRKRVVLIRRTGQLEKQLALIPKESWWQKNVWYIQFSLLFLGVNARILFLNSDRRALALFFIGVIICALAVGYFWGGKTWCNYVCPIAIVQKIYTEPRGLLESQAHLTRQTISQSMCRTSTPEGDRSICVGCTPNCPDIDLERSYWEGITDPARRHVYYGFYGLIVGFYSFYYFYSGNWDYYFSGAWTHEADQIANLFKPGLYLGGQAIGIPKIASAPMVIALAVGVSWILGNTLEAAFRYTVRKMQLPLTEPEIVNRCLSFCAYASINTFYLFGGRPNLSLLPTPALRLIDILIVALTTLWFWQAIERNPTRYRREGLASSLLQQLRKLNVDISRFLEGRKLEELKPDEIYVLAKTLPSFSREQRLQAYRNVLEDALRTGKADSRASLEILREVRVELGVTDEEHRQMLQELGIDGSDAILDPEKAATFENLLRIDNYRRVIEPILFGELDLGHMLSGPQQDAEVANTIRNFREIYQVSELEHAKVIASITGSGGQLLERSKYQLELLATDTALIFGLRCRMLADAQWQQISRLLIASTRQRTDLLCTKLFSILLTMGDLPESHGIAVRLAQLMGTDIETPLGLPVSSQDAHTWAQSLVSPLLELLRGSHAAAIEPLMDPATPAFHAVIQKGTNLSLNLQHVVQSEPPLVGALALTAISYLDRDMARQIADGISRDESSTHRLMTDVVNCLLGRQASPPVGQVASFSITLSGTQHVQRAMSFAQESVSVGRSLDNDVVIIGQAVSPHHLTVWREAARVQVRRANALASVFINNQPARSLITDIESGDRISFQSSPNAGPALVIEWAAPESDFTLESCDTVTKLLWLSGATIFGELELSALAEIALSAQIRRYARGAWLCRAGEPSTDAFLLQSGSADVVVARDGQSSTIGNLHEGAMVGELGVITGEPRKASIRIASPSAQILTINGEQLRWLMQRNSSVSMRMLSVVAGYIKN